MGTVDAKLLIHAGLIQIANGDVSEGEAQIQPGPGAQSGLLPDRHRVSPGGPSLRRLFASFALSLAALALVVPAASAHPLGNFTINHYSGIRVAADHVLVDHVTDFAEIPTFSERRAMDTDTDGDVSAAEAAAFEAQRCAELGSELRLASGRPGTAADAGAVRPLVPNGPGQPDHAPRLRLQRRPADGRAAGDGFHVRGQVLRRAPGLARDRRRGGRHDADRQRRTGCRHVQPPDASTRPTSWRSRSDSRRLSFTVSPGGPTLPAFSVPDAQPVERPGASRLQPNVDARRRSPRRPASPSSAPRSRRCSSRPT